MNLSGRPTNPGQLRTPVLLAPRSVSTGTGGFLQPGPNQSLKVSAWAKWNNVHGSEVWAAASVNAIDPATVLIRYLSGIDRTWYVSKDNGTTWYEITGLDNIEERNEYIELKVQRTTEG
jgi:head-tail adaptor